MTKLNYSCTRAYMRNEVYDFRTLNKLKTEWEKMFSTEKEIIHLGDTVGYQSWQEFKIPESITIDLNELLLFFSEYRLCPQISKIWTSGIMPNKIEALLQVMWPKEKTTLLERSQDRLPYGMRNRGNTYVSEKLLYEYPQIHVFFFLSSLAPRLKLNGHSIQTIPATNRITVEVELPHPLQNYDHETTQSAVDIITSAAKFLEE